MRIIGGVIAAAATVVAWNVILAGTLTGGFIGGTAWFVFAWASSAALAGVVCYRISRNEVAAALSAAVLPTMLYAALLAAVAWFCSGADSC